jgi:peptidoglycan L-alanyl-D-glutamate endopeptidase CwlK
MPQFGRRSKEQLSSCHADLQKLFNEVIKHYDCTILEGHRSNEEQEELFNQGKSKLKAGKSKHNNTPSLAVDVAPYHIKKPNIDWDCADNFYLFSGYVLGVANQLGIKIRWGGSWDKTLDVRNNKFNDLVHFELVIK